MQFWRREENGDIVFRARSVVRESRSPGRLGGKYKGLRPYLPVRSGRVTSREMDIIIPASWSCFKDSWRHGKWLNTF